MSTRSNIIWKGRCLVIDHDGCPSEVVPMLAHLAKAKKRPEWDHEPIAGSNYDYVVDGPFKTVTVVTAEWAKRISLVLIKSSGLLPEEREALDGPPVRKRLLAYCGTEVRP